CGSRSKPWHGGCPRWNSSISSYPSTWRRFRSCARSSACQSAGNEDDKTYNETCRPGIPSGTSDRAGEPASSVLTSWIEHEIRTVLVKRAGPSLSSRGEGSARRLAGPTGAIRVPDLTMAIAPVPVARFQQRLRAGSNGLLEGDIDV